MGATYKIGFHCICFFFYYFSSNWFFYCLSSYQWDQLCYAIVRNVPDSVISSVEGIFRSFLSHFMTNIKNLSFHYNAWRGLVSFCMPCVCWNVYLTVRESLQFYNVYTQLFCPIDGAISLWIMARVWTNLHCRFYRCCPPKGVSWKINWINCWTMLRNWILNTKLKCNCNQIQLDSFNKNIWSYECIAIIHWHSFTCVDIDVHTAHICITRNVDRVHFKWFLFQIEGYIRRFIDPK